MVQEVTGSDEYRGARFTRVDLSGAVLRDVDLTGARFLDAVLVDAGCPNRPASNGSAKNGPWWSRCVT
jgi:uncharacterized protein YjbI with pentapeptide repeats